jgi:hypothetical protein
VCSYLGAHAVRGANEFADALLANHRQHDWAGTSEHTNCVSEQDEVAARHPVFAPRHRPLKKTARTSITSIKRHHHAQGRSRDGSTHAEQGAGTW